MNKPRSVVTFSGGLDSATLIAFLLQQGHEVIALSVDYGQRHRIELDYAERFTQKLGVRREVADLRDLAHLLGANSLTNLNVSVPHGHYEAETMKQTIVPNRNMLLLSVATAFAVSQKAQFVAYAAHSGDHAIYPDCRPEFADAMAKAIGLCDWTSPELIRPFVEWSKAKIVREGTQLGVPYELTWSCYEGKALHCGACGTCIERREAFLLAHVPDPTQYDPNAPAMNVRDGKASINWTQTIKGQSRIGTKDDPARL